MPRQDPRDSARARISLKTKLAATLRTMLVEEDGKLVPFLDYETAKQMTEDQVLSLFHFDHDPKPKAFGGTDEHHNLVPRPIREHRIKTAKVDVPRIAKAARISADQEEFRCRMLAKSGQQESNEGMRAAIKKPSRHMPGSRGSPWRKRMDGRVERRR